jgi:uncharacterized membrane protein YagU involved in acid resistance
MEKGEDERAKLYIIIIIIIIIILIYIVLVYIEYSEIREWYSLVFGLYIMNEHRNESTGALSKLVS